MKLDITVTHTLPPARYITGQRRLDERMPDKPHSLGAMLQPPSPQFEPVVVVIAHVETGDTTSGYAIGQMLRAIADDVEAADERLRPKHPDGVAKTGMVVLEDRMAQTAKGADL